MPTRVKIYVAFVGTLAVTAGIGVYAVTPSWPRSVVGDVLLLCVLAIAGELLAYRAAERVAGSIGYIPYFAAAVLVPSWLTVVAVTLVRVGFEFSTPRQPIKRMLNISAYALMEATAILLFVGLGGKSLLFFTTAQTLTRVSQASGIAAIIAFVVSLMLNNFVVIGAIALATGRKIQTVWLDSLRSTIIIDLITSPLIFVFAWVYAAFGSIAAAAMWVPILGLRQVYRINIELERTNEELLELMVKSLEARDPYTSGHSRRVQHYSVVIARAIGLGERQIEEVGRAALLHDVGKIYEKYASVLSKQDKLTPEEWTIIQDHPADGANLVATMTRLRDVVPAIRGHHENWNGTGYPDGLAGDSIPLASRIIRFADTIDAMTTERPYRKPLTEEQVRAEIIKCRGSQFDPQIADRLLSSALWLTLFAPVMRETPRPTLSIISSRATRVRTIEKALQEA